MLARHVSDLTGPSSGAFFTSCICRFGMWYYCAYYSTRPAVTCRANIRAEYNSLIESVCVSCWTAYILQDDTRSLQYQDKVIFSIPLQADVFRSPKLSLKLHVKYVRVVTIF